jgi:hypothetical protein
MVGPAAAGGHVNIGFSRALARLRFKHRVTELADGGLAYRLGDGSAQVRVSRREWSDAGTMFNDATRASSRQAVVLLLCLPAYVAYIALSHVVVPAATARALPSWLYFLVFIAPLPGLPIAVYLRHARHVMRVSKAIDAQLAQRSRLAIVTRGRAGPPFWFDLLCLLFIGPQLLIAIIGEIDPDLFRNTPLSGRRIGGQAMLGFALILVRLAWGELARRRNQAPQASR